MWGTRNWVVYYRELRTFSSLARCWIFNQAGLVQAAFFLHRAPLWERFNSKKWWNWIWHWVTDVNTQSHRWKKKVIVVKMHQIPRKVSEHCVSWTASVSCHWISSMPLLNGQVEWVAVDVQPERRLRPLLVWTSVAIQARHFAEHGGTRFNWFYWGGDPFLPLGMILASSRLRVWQMD